jgi:hypothetical protein
MTTPYTQTEEYIESRQEQLHYEAVAQDKADMYYSNLQTQVTRCDVERAWREQVQAVDRWEWLANHRCPKHEVEAALENILATTAYAIELEELYSQQYDERWAS